MLQLRASAGGRHLDFLFLFCLAVNASSTNLGWKGNVYLHVRLLSHSSFVQMRAPLCESINVSLIGLDYLSPLRSESPEQAFLVPGFRVYSFVEKSHRTVVLLYPRDEYLLQNIS